MYEIYQQLGMTRKKAAILAMISVGFLGFLCTISGDVFAVFNGSPDLLLPLGGFFIVVFIGWFLSKDTIQDELSSGGAYKTAYKGLFMFLVKFVAPLAIALLFGLGVYAKLIQLFPSIG